MWAYDGCEVDEEADTITYTLYLNEILQTGKPHGDPNPENTRCVFWGFRIPDYLTKDEAKTLDNEFKIDVVAEVVQTENILPDGRTYETTAAAAKAAFAILDASSSKLSCPPSRTGRNFRWKDSFPFTAALLNRAAEERQWNSSTNKLLKGKNHEKHKKITPAERTLPAPLLLDAARNNVCVVYGFRDIGREQDRCR